MAITVNLRYTGRDGNARKFAELRDRYDLHMTVERYAADESGEGAGDEKFIRR